MKTLIIALSCLFSASVFSQNTKLGVGALNSVTTGKYNTAVGENSLYSNTTAFYNTAVGEYSLNHNITGYQNTALGYKSLYTNTTGYYNTAVGVNSLRLNNTGYSNTAVGWQSLYNNDTGKYNTALGYRSGHIINTGRNLTCIGNDAQPTNGSVWNEITLGNSSVTTLRCNAPGGVTFLSDMRDKKNIQELSLGLDFISKLKPRQFNWDRREWYENNVSDGSKMKEVPTAGFIAQELDEVQTTQNAEWLNLVLKNNPEKLEATPGNLLPVMVKAIQELKAENDELKKEVESLKSMNEKLAKLEQMVNELTSTKHTSLIETEASK